MIRGVVLAGGRSRRFGSDKALAVYQGESFLSRACNVLAGLNLFPVVVTRDGAVYSGHPLLYDYLPDKGPLGGIYTAMRKFPEDDFLVLTCDMPALEEKSLAPLLEEYAGRRTVPVFYRAPGGTVQPFPGIYPRGIFPSIFKNIFRDDLSMRSLIEALPEKNIVSFDGPPALLANINDPSGLKALDSPRFRCRI